MGFLVDIERAVVAMLTNKNHHHSHEPHESREDDKPTDRGSLTVTVRGVTITTSGDIKMAFVLKDSEFTVLHATALDAVGHGVDSATFVWGTSNPEIVTVQASADGKSATVTSTGALGDATVQVNVGALSATFAITVVSGDPVSISLIADPAQEISAAAPVADPVQ